MQWVPVNEFKHGGSIWLCKSYYKVRGEASVALLDELKEGEVPEAPMLQYLVGIVIHPEDGTWIRTKTKHGDLQDLAESSALDNVAFLLESKYRPLDFTANLGHDDKGRMMFYETCIYPRNGSAG